MERAASKLMQLAKRRLMIQQGPTAAAKEAGRAGEEGSFERSIQSLARLIKICNAKAASGGLQFNQAQCRLLDLQGFHDNIQNLVDGMAALGGAAAAAAAAGGRLAAAAIEVARVTANAEALVLHWSASPLADASYSSVPLAADAHWLIHAMASGCDGGMAAAQQHHDQQWCIAVMEVLLAQLRATAVDVEKQAQGQRTGGSGDGHQTVPFWMVERTFEIADEYLSLDVDDRGLSMAVRLDHRRLLDRLGRLTRSKVLRRIGNQISLKPQDVVVRFLVMKLEDAADGDYDGGIESYIERIHQREPWAAVYRSREPKQLLGGGSFGMLHVGDWLGMPAAVKIIPAVASVDDFWNEVSVLAAVNHPRLVSLLFAAVDNDGDNECRLWTELLGPDLGSILLSDAQKQPLSITVAVELILQVAEGMAYLHKNGILHRSLKATNVLLVPAATATIRRRRARAIGSGSNHQQHHLLDEFTRIKLADYGLPKTKLAGSMAMSSLSSTSSQVSYWVPPELDELEEPKFTRKTDVYDFGMLCYVIFSRSLPSSKAKPDILAHCPAYLAAFIQSCWNQDPHRRPTFETVCSFFKSLKSLLIRGGGDGRLPFTPSDFVNLRAAGLGLRFFVDAALLSRSRQRDEHKAAFPIDPFVLWLSTSMDQLEREEGFATAAEIAGDVAANWTREKHDFEQAVFWYHKSSSASASMILDRPSSPGARPSVGGAARWKLGLCLELGLGIAKDERRAVVLYKQAAREGFASAHVELGRCYQSGRGVQSANDVKAVSHFVKALELFESSFSGTMVPWDDGLRSTSTRMMTTTSTTMQAQSLACIDFYMNILAKGRRDEDCSWAGDLLHEVAAKSRVGRMIVAGRGCCNVRELVAMLGDWNIRDVGRRRAKMVLEKLAMEEDILQQALLA